MGLKRVKLFFNHYFQNWLAEVIADCLSTMLTGGTFCFAEDLLYTAFAGAIFYAGEKNVDICLTGLEAPVY